MGSSAASPDPDEFPLRGDGRRPGSSSTSRRSPTGAINKFAQGMRSAMRFTARSWRISTGAASRSCSRSPTSSTTAWSSARTGGSGCVISTTWISTGPRTVACCVVCSSSLVAQRREQLSWNSCSPTATSRAWSGCTQAGALFQQARSRGAFRAACRETEAQLEPLPQAEPSRWGGGMPGRSRVRASAARGSWA